MKIEELQGSLEAHEQRMNEKNPDTLADQALQAQTSRHKGGNRGKGWKGKGKGKFHSQKGGG